MAREKSFLQLLLKAARAITAGLKLEEVLDLIVKRVPEVVGVEAAPLRVLAALILAVSAALTAAAGDARVVPGTRVALAPPPQFVESDRFPGFVHRETNASIVVNEIPAAFEQTMAGLTAGGLKTRDIVLLRREPIAVGGLSGLLLHLSQNAYGVRYLKWVSVFGDERHTTMITASFPADAEARFSAPLREAVASAQVVSAPPPPEESAGALFDLAPAEGLKTARRLGSKLVMTSGGEFPAAKPTDPILVAGASTTRGLVVQNRRDFAIARALAIASLKEIRITKTRPVSIGGLEGFEVLAKALDRATGESMIVCQTLLFGRTDYFLMQGIARDADRGTYLPAFRKTMASFRLRTP